MKGGVKGDREHSRWGEEKYIMDQRSKKRRRKKYSKVRRKERRYR